MKRRGQLGGSHTGEPVTDGGENRVANLDVPLTKLSIINQLGMAGVNGVEDQLSGVGESGTANLHLRRVDFFDVQERHAEVGDGNVVGIRSGLHDVPGGHLLLLFDPSGAQYLAQLLMEDESAAKGNPTDGGRISEKEAQKFVGLIGNVMIGGFIEGWENALNRKIGHDSPTLLYDSADAIVQGAADEGRNLAALLFDMQLEFRMSDTETANVDTWIYAFPDTELFVQVLNALGN